MGLSLSTYRYSVYVCVHLWVCLCVSCMQRSIVSVCVCLCELARLSLLWSISVRSLQNFTQLYRLTPAWVCWYQCAKGQGLIHRPSIIGHIAGAWGDGGWNSLWLYFVCACVCVRLIVFSRFHMNLSLYISIHPLHPQTLCTYYILTHVPSLFLSMFFFFFCQTYNRVCWSHLIFGLTVFVRH